MEGDGRALIGAYDGEDLGLIFLSESTRNPGCPLAVGAFDEIIERVREKVGLRALTPHTLRHQRCTILKRAGVSLEDIALLAGHKSTDTTRLYIHLAPTELSERIRTSRVGALVSGKQRNVLQAHPCPFQDGTPLMTEGM